ncbi:putative ribonuclease H-like domain-containing protein [Tanacetum coccineum]
MDLETAQTTTTAKLPILKQGEYDMWRLRIEQYFQVQDYALWDVIENGNSFKPVAQTTTNADGTSTSLIPGPVTTEEKVQKKNDVKARSMLLMALPNEHLMTFNQYKDAKTLFAAIQTRFGGNEATKKTQKTLLKQMLQKIKKREKVGKVSNGDTVGRAGERGRRDYLYNNFKIVEQEVKRTASSSSSSTSHNMAFVSSPSSTNEVNTAYGSPNGSQFVYEDLEQIHEDDLEEMNLKWQLALLSMRTRRFFQKIGKKITINRSDTAGYDKSKVECFNCHKMGHFTRECKGPWNQDSRKKNQDRSKRTVNVEETSSKAMVAINGADVKARSMLLMALPNEHVLAFNQYMDAKTLFVLYKQRFGDNEVKGTTSSSSSSSSSSQNIAFVSSPSSTNKVNTANGVSTATLKLALLALNQQWSQLVYEDLEQIHEDDIEEMDLKWQLALLSMRTRRFFQKTGRKITINESDTAGYDKSKVECFNCHKMGHFAREKMQRTYSWWIIDGESTPHLGFDVPVGSQIPDKSRKGVGFVSYNAVQPPPIGLFSPLKFDLSNSGLEEFQQLEFEGYGPKPSKSFSEDTSNEVRESLDAPLVEELVSDDKLEKKTVFPTVAKIEFVRPKQQEKLVRKPVKYAEMYRSQSHKAGGAVGMVLDLCKAKGLVTALGILGGLVEMEIGKHVPSLRLLRIIKDMLPLGDEPKEGKLLVNEFLKLVLLNVPRKNNMYSVDMRILFTWVFFLATKDETSGILKRFITEIENLVDKKVKIIRCDNGTEFKNKVMSEFCEQKGIKKEFSIVRTPQQNGTENHKDYSLDHVIGDVQSGVLTRRMTKTTNEQGFISAVYEGKSHEDLHTCLFACFLSQEEPKKVIQALKDPSWIEAMQEELLQFKNKKDERGIVIRNKARLVAQGYTQEEGIDYDEVFAPVARIKAIRLFLAYASFKDFVVYQMDVKSAFLYGKIEEEVYVYQPPGFEDPEFPDRVYKVEKALYGLHQAPRAWNETLSTYLLENGFQRGTIDKTLFIKKVKGDILLVQVYADDIIFGSTKKELCTEFEKLMHKKFQMSSMGELTFFLGLQVMQKEDGIFISQDKYVDEILKNFSLSTMRITSTPMETSKPLLKDAEAEDVDVHLYRSMIGSLMDLTTSRPDIIFAVCGCARLQVTPKVSHLHAVKRIFRYLKGQPKLGLWYPKDSPLDLEAYSDSDYAGASLDKKSTTGGCQFLRSRLISWQCKKQTIVANFTTKAEYVAAANFCGQVLWIQNQMLDYGYNFINTKIFIDNESTICIVKNLVFHSKTKHIKIRHHFIRDSYEKILIQVIKIHTDHNVADLLTKALDCYWHDLMLLGEKLVLPGKKLMLLGQVSTARKKEDNTDFAEIVDFLNASPSRYASTVSLTVYVSYIEQFWSTAKIKTVNKETQIRDKVDGETIVIIESSVRRDLHFNDEDGITFLTNTKIFENLQLMGTNPYRCIIISTQRVQKHRKTKRKATNISQSSGPTTLVADETVHEEKGDNLERAATAATSLDVEHSSGNIKRTQSTAIPNDHFPQGIGLGGSLRCQDTILGDRPAQTRFERLFKQSNEPPLLRVNTLRSGEDSMKLNKLMEIYIKLSKRVLDLENVKNAHALEIQKLKKRVKKLESKKKSRTLQLKRRLFKVRIESSIEKSLGDQEDSSKQGRNEIDQDEGISWFQEDSMIQGRYGYDIGVNTASTSITTASINITTTEPVTTASEPVTTIAVSITVEPSTPPTITTTTTTPIKDEDLTIAQTLMKIKSEKSKAKGRLQAELDEEARLEREREKEASKAANIAE